ncbi:MAG: TIGR04283 family arsenosugar biosynthesis glycosyltransferase [Gammaproteobacteria bacterium]
MNFSIIIPTLNEVRSIQNCLAALQPLRRRCEIIVADGGSTDDTRTLAEGMADRIILSEPGRARQMNSGAQLASGATLLFLHADTVLPDMALDLIRDQLDDGKQWGRFDIRLDGDHVMFRVIEQMMNWRSRMTGIATGDQCLFVTKRAFMSAGPYPEIELMEDIALSKALKRVDSPACLRAKVTSSSRKWRREGIFRTIVLMWSLRLRYYFGTDPAVLARAYYRRSPWKP